MATTRARAEASRPASERGKGVEDQAETAAEVQGSTVATRQATPEGRVVPLEKARRGSEDGQGLWRQALDAQREGRIDEAITAYRRMISTMSVETASPWINLGIAYRVQKKYLASLGCYGRALELKPDDPAVLSNLGNVLKDLGRFDAAVDAHCKALARKPGHAVTHHNYGIALRESGDIEAALAAFETACRLDPDNASAQWDRAIALLYLGRFDEGWAAFEWRWRIGEIEKQFQSLPEWRGEEFKGKTLLVYPEQGFGDTILASRFLPQAKERGGEVVLMCKPPLRRLFSSLEGVDRFIELGEEPGDVDYQCPAMSLPGLFKTTHDTIPPPPRLHLPQEARRKFQPLIERAGDRFKVGVVWSGSLTFKGNANRSTPIDRFLNLAEVPGIQLYSLQKGSQEKELHESSADALMIDVGGKVEDFADTAVVVDQLDLVIMTDSSVAHLCGSLGKPVWNLLNHVPYWLYQMKGETTPWYPSLRLIRQPVHGDWDCVFRSVERRLAQAVASKRAGLWPA